MQTVLKGGHRGEEVVESKDGERERERGMKGEWEEGREGGRENL